MPPMLDIPSGLTGRAAQQVLAQKVRLCVDERHRVLQLVAKTECASRLVVSLRAKDGMPGSGTGASRW